MNNELLDFTHIEVKESCISDSGILDRRKTKKKRPIVSYKLGETIANDIKYFGQEKIVKGERTAVCICHCGKSWRVIVSRIARGVVKSCGCRCGRKVKQ